MIRNVGVNEMKKEYVKPIMEGEAFVANEYIAACWTIDCLECGAYDEVYDKDKQNYMNASTALGYDTYTYPGKINGVDPCRSTTETSKPSWVDDVFLGELIWWALKKWFGAKDDEVVSYYHTIQFENSWTHSNHPNASV